MLGKIKSSELDMDIYTFILFLPILPTIDTPDNVVRLNKVKTTNIKSVSDWLFQMNFFCSFVSMSQNE